MKFLRIIFTLSLIACISMSFAVTTLAANDSTIYALSMPSPKDDTDEGVDEEYAPITAVGAATPRLLVAPGKVSISIKVSNEGDDTVNNVTILGPDDTILDGPKDMPVSDFKTFKMTHMVTSKELNAGKINFTIKYTLAPNTEYETQHTIPVTVLIHKQKAEPKLEFTRQLSSKLATVGQVITATYTVKNTGNVQLKDISITDPLVGKVGTVDLLDVGMKKTITKKITISKEATSRPKAVYSYVGSSEQLTNNINSTVITIAKPDMQVQLEADKTLVRPGEIVNLTCTLKNNGNISYRKLKISDELLGAMDQLPDLKIGESQAYTKQVTIQKDSTYTFTITGTDSANNSVTFVSNPITIKVSNLITNNDIVVTATVDDNELTKAGPVKFMIQVNNMMEASVQRVDIYEKTRGIIKRINILAPGIATIEQTYDVAQDDTFQFYAVIGDVDGGLQNFNASPIDVTIADPIVNANTPLIAITTAAPAITDTPLPLETSATTAMASTENPSTNTPDSDISNSPVVFIEFTPPPQDVPAFGLVSIESNSLARNIAEFLTPKILLYIAVGVFAFLLFMTFLSSVITKNRSRKQKSSQNLREYNEYKASRRPNRYSTDELPQRKSMRDDNGLQQSIPNGNKRRKPRKFN